MDGLAKPVSTLLASHFKLSAYMSPSTDDGRKKMKNVSYANAVGALMHAMAFMRPNISHVVSMVNRYMHDPRKRTLAVRSRYY